MKTENLEVLKAFVTSVSGKYPEKLAALLVITEKHYFTNQSKCDAVMQHAQGKAGACGFSVLRESPVFVSEMLALR